MPSFGDEGYGACLGHEEVGSGDAHPGGHELASELPARFTGKVFDVVIRGGAELFHEQVGHLAPGLVYGGSYDVKRSVAGQLDDVLAEVSLDGFDALRFELVVQAHLLGEHRLALDHEINIPALRHADDVAGRLGGVFCEEYVPSGLLDVLGEQIQVVVQIFYNVGLDLPSTLPEIFPA